MCYLYRTFKYEIIYISEIICDSINVFAFFMKGVQMLKTLLNISHLPVCFGPNNARKLKQKNIYPEFISFQK